MKRFVQQFFLFARRTDRMQSAIFGEKFFSYDNADLYEKTLKPASFL